MLTRYKDLKEMDLVKEITKFKKELAEGCPYYSHQTSHTPNLGV